jgi:hypothetical protein
MRTSRRSITVTMAPPEWRKRCRKSAPPTKDRPTWWRRYVDLIEEGFIPCPGSWTERQNAEAMRCGCGGGMHLEALELIGDQGELVAYRAFAVCSTCRAWVEF